MQSNLRDAARFRCHLDHLAAFGNGEAERLFDVDILARPASCDALQSMPMVRRRDHDGVDVFVLEKLAIVGIKGGLPANFFLCRLSVGLIEIAKRNYLSVPMRQKRIEQLIAPIPQANDAKPDPIVARLNNPGRQRARGGHSRGDSGLLKLTAIEKGIHGRSF
jgi:hypothetical protein